MASVRLPPQDFAVRLPSRADPLAGTDLASEAVTTRSPSGDPHVESVHPTQSVRPKIVALTATGAVLLVAACSSNSDYLAVIASLRVGTSSTATGATSSGSGTAAVEVHPAGDIPDSQAFVPYRDSAVCSP